MLEILLLKSCIFLVLEGIKSLVFFVASKGFRMKADAILVSFEWSIQKVNGVNKTRVVVVAASLNRA